MKYTYLKKLLLLVSVSAIASITNASSYHWQGFYLGATTGPVFSQFDATTQTQPGTLFNSQDATAVNNAGNQHVNTSGFFSGIDGGYNWQSQHLLLGLEVDLQSLSSNGETNTSAISYPARSAQQFILTAYSSNNWLATFRPRLGFVRDNWLFYLTGGLGFAFLQTDFILSDTAAGFESQRVRKIVPGYVVGAGIETGLTDHVSVKAEYLFADFKQTNASPMNQYIPPSQSFSNRAKLNANLFRLGINYHFDEATPGNHTPLWQSDEWQTEVGARLFLSNGTDGAPQPLFGNPGMQLASRLTFSNLQAIAGETFARADHIGGFFTKGYIGSGSITTGQLNDEDFPAGGAYSNTYSNALGNLSYATIDMGYSFLKTSTAKVGAFVGYNYYAENINIYNCRQLAGATVCAANGSDLNNFLALSEDDQINSLRVGLTTQFNLTNDLTFTSEAAYLPAVNFKGTDMHNARALIGPEQSARGDGAMLESILDYRLTRNWKIGIGGRYWMWNMPTGSVAFNFLTGGIPYIQEPAAYCAERYGVFLQLSYRDNPADIFTHYTSTANWRGIFVGGQMGGAWGQSHWSDPFATSSAGGGLQNVAGFGDNINATGPLGGVRLNINWQTNQFVYGLDGSINTSDIRGQNTLFSGLGGVNGRTVTNYFGTLVAKVGLARDRTLFYVNGGRAALNTTYNINANTGVLALGADSETLTNWGWTAGVGVEYAITDQWTSNVEYDYVHIPSTNLSFPAINTINTQSIAANQSMNIFKVGINYKLTAI